MSNEQIEARLLGALVGAIVGDASNSVYGQTSSQLMLFSFAGALRSAFEMSEGHARPTPLPEVASALKNWAHLRGAPWTSVHLSPDERYRCWLMDEPSMWNFDDLREADPLSLRGVRRVRLDDHALAGSADPLSPSDSLRQRPNTSNTSRATGVALGALVPALLEDDMSGKSVSELGSSLVGLVRGGGAAQDAGGLFVRLLRRCIIDGFHDSNRLYDLVHDKGLTIRQRRSLKQVLTRLAHSQEPPWPADQKHGATAFEALEIVLPCLIKAQSPEEAIEQARQVGGPLSDAPMLVGALLGACIGAEAMVTISHGASPLLSVAAALVEDFSLLRTGGTTPTRYAAEFHPPGARSLHRYDFSTGALTPLSTTFDLDHQFGPRSSVRSVTSVSIVFSHPYESHPTNVSETGVHFAKADDSTLFVHLHPTPTGDPAMHGPSACLSLFAGMVAKSQTTNADDFLRWCMASSQAGAMVPGASRGLMRTAEIPRRMSDAQRALDEDLAVFNLQRKARP